MSTVKNQDSSQETQSYAFVNGTQAFQEEEQVINAFLNEIMQELEELVEKTGITSFSDVKEHSMPQKFQQQFQKLEQSLRGMAENHKGNHSSSHYSASVKSSLIEMTAILAEMNQQMEESEAYNLEIESHMLESEQANAQEQYQKAEKHSGFFGHLLKDLTYVVQAVTFVACVATGNIAMAVAIAAISIMMDTGATQKLEQGLESAGLPPVVAKAVEALIMVVLVVGAAATGDFALAGEAAAEETAGAVAEEGTSIADEAKTGEKSLSKTLAGIGLMTGSSTMLENNFVASVVKHMNNDVLRDVIGSLLMIIEIVGAAYGGYSAATAGTDSQFISSSLQSLSEVSDGVMSGDPESIEKMSQTVMKLAKYAAGGAMAMEGTAQIGSAINEGFVAEAMKNITLINQSQEVTRNMIQDRIGFITEVQKEYNQLFKSMDLGSTFETVAKILGQ